MIQTEGLGIGKPTPLEPGRFGLEVQLLYLPLMTDEEHELLSDLADGFWLSYSRLVGETLSRAPEHLRDVLLPMLQDKSSVYGSMYEEYIGDGDGNGS